MAQKKVWVTWMAAQEGAGPQPVVQALAKNGLDPSGAAWVDDLDNMAWTELSDVLLDVKRADVWLIAGDRASLSKVSNRYALSLVTAMIRENRGPEFPIMWLGLDFTPETGDFPALCNGFQTLGVNDPAWSAKVVAAGFARKKAPLTDFRFNVRANAMFGQWFEVGPREGEWNGAMFGVSEPSKITHHAVGPRGTLPERTVLEYQLRDIKAQLGDTAVTAWAVKNRITTGDSYYIKVEGAPDKVIVGGYPGEDDEEVTIVSLI